MIKMPTDTIYLTKIGLKKLREELEFLIKIKRVELAKEIEEALNGDGPEDNFEYDIAKEEQMLVEKRIIELSETIRTAKLISKQRKNAIVDIGSTILVEIDGEKLEYTIVGSFEANPMEGLISNESPLGKALMGSSKGEDIQVESEGSRIVYKVVKVK